MRLQVSMYLFLWAFLNQSENGAPSIPDVNVVSHSSHRNHEKTVARSYRQVTRVLCWVLTCPWNHQAKALHVKKTWGKRCNVLLFMSSRRDKSIPTIGIHGQEGRAHLWHKTKAAFHYIHKHYLDKADWFLKADDDTYVVVENLRYMLFGYDTNKPMYFGHRFKKLDKKGYMSGGAGYVLSKAALKVFVKNEKKKCSFVNNQTVEDVSIGKCLNHLGVRPMDSRDLYTRQRFLPLSAHDHLRNINSSDGWFQKFTYYPVAWGIDCCSDYAISFHYVDPGAMYLYDYLIYHLRPYGLDYLHHPSDAYEQ